MHICQIVDAFAIGGATKVIVRFADQARKNNIKVTAIGLEEASTNIIWDELNELGVNIRLSSAKKLYTPGRIWDLVKSFKEQQVDVIQSHLSYSNILSPVVGRLAGIPVVGTLHTTRFRNEFYRPIIFRSEMAVLRYGANGIIAVAQPVVDTYQKYLGRKRLYVITNSVEQIRPLPETDKQSLRTELMGNPRNIMLISVGRLTQAKGYHDLIHAFSIIHRAHPNARLFIAGGGSMKEELEAHAANLNLSNKITLLGERSDISRLLAASDMFLSSSHWEGMPIVILEAMSTGLPVVATRVGGVPEVLEGRGTLVPAQNPDVFAQAVIDLLKNPEEMKRTAQVAKDYVQKYHSPEKWFKDILRYYAKVSPRFKRAYAAQLNEDYFQA